MSAPEPNNLIAAQTNEAVPLSNVEQLVVSAEGAFRLLKPWLAATNAEPTQYPEFDCIIHGIKNQAHSFFNAIRMSVDTCNVGVSFAQDAITLCVEITKMPAHENAHTSNDDVNLENILSYLQGLEEIANETYKQAERTLQRFRSVRTDVIELQKNIPQVVDIMFSRRQKSQKSVRLHENFANFAAAVTQSLRSPDLAYIPFSTIVLPLFDFTSTAVEGRERNKAEDREKEVVSCQQVLDRLRRVEQDLSELLARTNEFAQWWLAARRRLEYLKTMVLSEKINSLQLENVREHWNQNLNLYTEYISSIERVEDCYSLKVHELEDPLPSCEGAIRTESSSLIICRVEKLSDTLKQVQAAFLRIWQFSSMIKDKYVHPLRCMLLDIKNSLQREVKAAVVLLRVLVELEEELCRVKLSSTPGIPEDCARFSDAMHQVLIHHTQTTASFSLHRESVQSVISEKRVKADTLAKFLPRSSASDSEVPQALGCFEKEIHDAGMQYATLSLVDFSKITLTLPVSSFHHLRHDGKDGNICDCAKISSERTSSRRLGALIDSLVVCYEELDTTCVQ